MNLSQNYKILPFPINCDTIFLTFSPYYNIKMQQITQYDEILPFLSSIENQYKVVVLAESYSEGTEIVSKINQAKEEKVKSHCIFQQSNSPILENDYSNDKLTSLLNSMLEKTQNKRSMLHVKGMLVQIQSKIERLNNQIFLDKKDKMEPFCLKKLSKKIKKFTKMPQKRLDELKNKRNLLKQQLQQKQNNHAYLKELTSQNQVQNLVQNNQHSEEQQWLLYNSEQQKQNNINH